MYDDSHGPTVGHSSWLCILTVVYYPRFLQESRLFWFFSLFLAKRLSSVDLRDNHSIFF